MEVFTAAIGILECIDAAKQLYDLRSKYKDASLMITAIYSESLVIAASLSQIQSLLQRNALQDKPELSQTFNQALTGCRVVYTCLKEEVRELSEKATNDNLRFKDRAKYAWKADTFKELLQQIRGQQTALTLLIQGLQMESLSEIHKLVQDNSAKLDQVARRSNTLRQKHPKIKVPETVFDKEANPLSYSDAHSALSSAEFAFDDEVVNSLAYRRAMALAVRRADGREPAPDLVEGDLIDLTSPIGQEDDDERTIVGAVEDMKSLDLGLDFTTGQNTGAESAPQVSKHEHTDLLDALEQSMLPFMPPHLPASPRPTNTTPPPAYTAMASEASSTRRTETPTEDDRSTQLPASSSSSSLTGKPPPLPPRPPKRAPYKLQKSTTVSEVDQVSDSISISSEPSAAPYFRTLSEPISNDSFVRLSVNRKPLPLSHKSSSYLPRQFSAESEKPSLALSIKDPEMHSIWLSLADAETKFIDRMTKFRMVFYDSVIIQWPALAQHLEVIQKAERLVSLHKTHLLDPLNEQISLGESATCNPTIFESWASQIGREYKQYFQHLPHAESSLRLTRTTDPKFSQFVGMLGLSIIWFGKTWEDYLRLPITQLECYGDHLGRLTSLCQGISYPIVEEYRQRLEDALEIIKAIRQKCLATVIEGIKREEVGALSRRIQMADTNMVTQLSLSEPGRRILFQSSIAIKTNGKGPWQSIQAVLLDNYLLWGKIKPSASTGGKFKARKGDVLWIRADPIPVSGLEFSRPPGDDQFQRSTFLDEIARGAVLYEIFVKDKASTSKPHTLGIFDPRERQRLFDQLTVASEMSVRPSPELAI